MATLDTRSFSTIVGNIAAGVQGRATALLDYSIGSVLRSIAEAEAGVALWLQGQILRVLLLTRAATSIGADLDTWVNDYGVSRLGVANATGFVQFSRFTTTAVGFVPVGALIRTADLFQAYTVTSDPTNLYYNATTPGYNLAIGVASVTVPVVSTTGGFASNVAPGTVTVISSNVAGIDTVNNSAAFSGGSDPESDAQLRARFVLYIASLSKGTLGALGYSIVSLQLGLQYIIHENVDVGGGTDNGMLTIYVDDGSGSPPTSVVIAAQAAVNLTRAAGIRAGVYAASGISANVSMNVAVIPGYLAANVAGSVSAALTTYVNTLGIESPLFYTKLIYIAYSIPGVNEVTNVLLNTATADIVPGMGQTIKSGTISVSAA